MCILVMLKLKNMNKEKNLIFYYYFIKNTNLSWHIWHNSSTLFSLNKIILMLQNETMQIIIDNETITEDNIQNIFICCNLI